MKPFNQTMFIRRLLFLSCLIPILLLCSSLQAQRSVNKIYEDYKQSITVCDNCLTKDDPGAIDIYENALNECITKIDSDRTMPELVRNLLKVRINVKLNEILQKKAESSSNSPNDKRDLSSLNKHILQLYIWLNSQTSLSQVWEEAQKLPNSSKESLSYLMENTNLSPSKGEFNSKWESIRAEVETRIEAAENYIYNAMTPDKTLKQMDDFLRFGDYGSRGRYNHNMEDAFLLHFLLYCADGEPTTIRAFEALIRSRNIQLQNDFMEKLKSKQEYISAQRIADEGNRLVNSENPPSSLLGEFIKKAAPRETAFLALQKLCAPHINERDYQTALAIINQYETLFKDKPFYQSSGINFNRYKAIVQKLSQGGIRNFSPIPLGIANPQINFSFDHTNQYAFLHPYPAKNGSLKVYKKIANSWQHQKDVTYNQLQEYFFKSAYLTPGKEYEIEPRDGDFLFGQKRDSFVNGRANADFFISRDRRIAFFVSNSGCDRKSMAMDGKEYLSPWANEPTVTSQWNNNSESFHGRVDGNGNTDIYYAISENGGRTWSLPKNLGNMVNTPFSERSPILSEDGQTLYFSSEGHGSLGGYDVFSIPVRRDGKNLVITGEVNHVEQACSTKDDLFYQVLWERENREEVYLSSNREGSFKIFSRTVDQISAITAREEPGMFLPFPEWPSKKMKLELICDTFPAVRKITPPGKIQVRGRVFDSKERLIKSGYITFYTKLGAGSAQDHINEEDEGVYSILVDENKHYKVSITATTVDGPEAFEYLEEFTKICPQNLKRDALALHDYQTKEPKKGEVITNFDFFFDTNKFNSFSINTDLNDRFYKDHVELRAKYPNTRLLLEGYADIRGTPGHNMELSKQRAQRVKKHLVNLGFREDQITIKACGPTTRFDNESFDKLMPILPNSVLNFNQQERRWLLNRRVRVLYD